ncbi:uncharacterized protein LOC129774564 [Toxorhynchites rutilus septentrionalis]|uniref:uncharacterized protein LOC129774564 n=1 Tax=Toxorhynchites rutilus septentrionalis TaxID=329112 RepID=UPI00247AFD33|nr:uncharacterized protein LOC129774564 [Toxorhynchites rutilus septentrionalis]
MKSWSLFVTILAMVEATLGNREHKVHNIVLYPDKHSWCSTRNISQVISYPGCKQVTIDNNVCVGACFSYSIPHTEPSDPGEVIGPYCDSCQPSETSWHHVTLDCSENSNNNGDEEAKPTVLVKQVQIIKNCSCTSCEKQTHKKYHHHHHEHNHVTQVPSTTSSLIQNDIPELLEVVPYNENDTEVIHHSPVHSHQSGTHGTTYLQQHQLNHYEHHSHTENVKKLLHQKIATLLKSVETTNSKTDREQLIEMIKLIKGSSDRNWDELMETLKSESNMLDFERLRNELEAEGSDQISAPHHHKPKTPEQEDHERLLKHQFVIVTQSPHPHPPPHHNNHNHHQHQASSSPPSSHHHAAGEKLDQHHHLQRGPHGALIIASDDEELSRMDNGHEIKQKINIHSHELKPNHAGAILTYDNHHSEHLGESGAHHHVASHPHSGKDQM